MPAINNKTGAIETACRKLTTINFYLFMAFVDVVYVMFVCVCVLQTSVEERRQKCMIQVKSKDERLLYMVLMDRHIQSDAPNHVNLRFFNLATHLLLETMSSTICHKIFHVVYKWTNLHIKIQEKKHI